MRLRVGVVHGGRYATGCDSLEEHKPVAFPFPRRVRRGTANGGTGWKRAQLSVLTERRVNKPPKARKPVAAQRKEILPMYKIGQTSVIGKIILRSKAAQRERKGP